MTRLLVVLSLGVMMFIWQHAPAYAAPPLPQGSRILGMDVNEAQDGDFVAAFNLAMSAGMQATSLTVYWDDIETAPGV